MAMFNTMRTALWAAVLFRLASAMHAAAKERMELRLAAGPPQPPEYLANAAGNATVILNKAGVTWMIAYGSSIGFARNGKPVAGDDDVDLFVAWDDVPKAVKGLTAAGIKFSMWDERFGRAPTDDEKRMAPIEIFTFREVGRIGVTYVCSDYCRDGFAYDDIHPITTQDVEINGQKLTMPVPHNVDNVLTQLYGDWRKPTDEKPIVGTFTYYSRCTNMQGLKIMVPLWFKDNPVRTTLWFVFSGVLLLGGLFWLGRRLQKFQSSSGKGSLQAAVDTIDSTKATTP